MKKILALSELEQDFEFQYDIRVEFPSRFIYLSDRIIKALKLNNDTRPKTLDQWYELCHPENHNVIQHIEHAISNYHNGSDFISFIRKLYCGDGVYRSFKLDAIIKRNDMGNVIELVGHETQLLAAWLENSNDGDLIQINNKIYEAVNVQGIMTLRDLDFIHDTEQENLRLRREIQKRIFNVGSYFENDNEQNYDYNEILDGLAKNINSALNSLTGNNNNNRLNAIKRVLNSKYIIVGVTGLSGSGKSTFLNALLGEKLLPENSSSKLNIPVICSNGDTRHAVIYYQNGMTAKISGDKLNSAYIKNLSSQELNRTKNINNNGIERIEIFIPGALIPNGFKFVDSPNFYAPNGNVLVRNLIPEFDLIIYITPIRTTLKILDNELIKNLGYKILFVLTGTDLENDDTEAGRIVFSRQHKIANVIAKIKNVYKNPVIPISSKLALEKFYDRKSNEWLKSNIDSVINFFAPLKNNIFQNALYFRAERFINILQEALKRKMAASMKWRLRENLEAVENLIEPLKDNIPEFSEYETIFADDINSDNNSSKNLIASLFTSVREREFRTKFYELETFRFNRRIIILSPDQNESVKLFSRLAHDIRITSTNFNPRDFLYSGDEILTHANVSARVINGLHDDILIAPSDEFLSDLNLNYYEIFSERVPVINFDLARIDTAIYELEHAQYFNHLKNLKWVLAFGNGGLLESRQDYFTHVIPERLRNFVKAHLLEMPELFIYENYKIIPAQNV